MKRFSLHILLLWRVAHLCAQDPAFSQFHATRAYLNPALVGIQPGIAVNLAYRDQWTAVPGAFRTLYSAVEVQEPYLKSGFGLSILHNAEGQAAMITQKIAFHYNYFVSPNFHIGIAPNVTRKYLDWKNYVFSGQLDPVFGNNGTLPPAVLDQIYSFDVGVGAAYRGDLTGKFAGHYVLGVSALHLWPWRNQSLQNLETMTPTRLTVHGGVELPLVQFFDGDVRPRKLTCLPSFKYDYQGKISLLALGVQVIYQNTAYIGCSHQNSGGINGRNTNAFSFLLGFKTPVGKQQILDFGINYDVNGTGLSLQTGGVLEMSMNMSFAGAHLFSNKHANGKRILKCESFF